MRTLLTAGLTLALCGPAAAQAPLQVGFGEADVTPELGTRPVYLAGFGHNRAAKGVLDPITVRTVLLDDGTSRVAFASADIIGLFQHHAESIRAELPQITHLVFTSTHNHEGPDTLGLWGSSPFASGFDPVYVKRLKDGVIASVKAAMITRAPVTASLGSVRDADMLGDSRKPYVKHDELVALKFTDTRTDRTAGVVVQWNCHPETLGRRNELVSADYVAHTVAALKASHRCPVVYLTGTVGGLMSSSGVVVRDAKGRELDEGTREKTEGYGRLVAALADKALASAAPVRLSPMKIHRREIYLPVDNKLYRAARLLKVMERPVYRWTGDPRRAGPLPESEAATGPACVRSELAYLELGELNVVCVPGEVYPELVLGKVVDPPEAGADFPAAPVEPALYSRLPGPRRMIVGLANDEIGYIIPKRQWDEREPFTYGAKKAPYGEINSLGPDTAPLLCGQFDELVREALAGRR